MPLPGWFLSWADVASYLTNSMPTLERFPISFKTYFSGNYFRHIVLGVNFGGRYGALGMSRREDLMYKPPAFRTLSELVLDYEAAYSRCWHVLKKVKLGQCVSHDPHSVEQIEWKHSILDVDRLGREDFRKELERHARDMRLKVSQCGLGAGPRACVQALSARVWKGKGCCFPVGHSSGECHHPLTPFLTAPPPSQGGVRIRGPDRWDVSTLIARRSVQFRQSSGGQTREGSGRWRQASWFGEKRVGLGHVKGSDATPRVRGL